MALLSTLLRQIQQRVRLMVGRAVLALVDDTTKLQTLQVALLAGEVRDGERFQNYGFTSHPLPGAEAVVVFPGGNRDHPIIVAVDDRRHRKTGLSSGESAMYHHEGDYIKLKNGRIIEVVAGTKLDVTAPEVNVVASTKVTMTTPEAEITGNLTVGGNTAVVGNATVGGTTVVTGALSSLVSVADPTGTMQAMRSVYNSHTHSAGPPPDQSM